MKDPWKDLRQKLPLYGNVEPSVKLISITKDLTHNYPTEILPALYAGMSYGREPESPSSDIVYYQRLNRQLLELEHDTPFECVQYSFNIKGLSKAAGAQVSRHRIGTGHISLSRRYTKQRPEFVYPIFAHLKDELTVGSNYAYLSEAHKDAYAKYLTLLDFECTKQEARLIMPVSVATERNMWINARALRNFLKLRLEDAAEPEIRRLSFIILDIVYKETPSIFEDIYKNFHSD